MTYRDAIRAWAGRDGWDTIVSDGATDWDLANLYDAVDVEMELTDDDVKRNDYDLQPDGIYRVKADGYLHSTPIIRRVK